MISLTTLLLVILIVLLVMSLPAWPYTRTAGVGYYPATILGVLLVVILVLLLLGYVPR